MRTNCSASVGWSGVRRARAGWVRSRMAGRALVVLMAACGGCRREEASPPTTHGSAAPGAALPAALFVTKAPVAAIDVRAAIGGSASDAVTVRGRIAGSKQPFVEGRAMFTLLDLGVKTCADEKDEGCTTPWDCCCTPREEIASGSVVVQIADAGGSALKVDLRGKGGLAEMAEVTVTGRITRTGGNPLLSADSIFVSPR